MKVTLEKFGDIIASGTLLGRIGSTEVRKTTLISLLADFYEFLTLFFILRAPKRTWQEWSSFCPLGPVPGSLEPSCPSKEVFLLRQSCNL